MMISARRLLTGLLLSTTVIAAGPVWAQPASAPEAAPQDTAPPEDGEEIVVTGRYIPDEKRETSEIVSLLSAADLARGGDSDIAGALTRVTGLSLVGGRFVFVRGLGGRYSSALLDGSVLPSPEPLRRVVPLDVFPTELLSGTVVQKTYSVEYPGEFAGGLISLRSKTVPDENFVTMSISGGVNDASTFDTGIGFRGGDLDIIGFRDNTYALPVFVATNPSLNGFNAGQLQLAGRALVNNGPGFSLDRFQNYPDFGGDLSIGRRFDIGGMSAGLLVTATYGQEIRNVIGVRNRYSATATGLDFFASYDPASCVGINPALDPKSCGLFQTTQTITFGALGSFGLEIDGDNTVTAKSIILRKTDKVGESQRGIAPISGSGNILSNYRLAFIEQELWINQLTGEHKFELGVFPDSVMTWRASYDRASRVTPYRTDYQYILSPTDTTFQLSPNPNQVGINFTGLRDDNYEGGMDFVLKGDPFGFESVFKIGGLYTRKNRGFASRRYAFLFPSGSTAELRRFVPEIIFSPDNIGPGGFVLTQTDGPANSYDATQEIIGGYVSTELQIAEPLRITAGVRYERSTQIVSGAVAGTLDQFGPVALQRCRITGAITTFATPISCKLTANRLLPAATATFEFAKNMQLRAGYSRTLSRPDLRELSPAGIINIEDDIEELGNPSLAISSIDNFDARYEWYFGDKQLFSLGGFYKKIANPIEQTIDPFGESGRRRFFQADKATVYGGEAELTLTVPWDRWLNGDFFAERRAFVIGNITYSKSTIDTGGDPVLTSQSRALQGQSEWLGNLQIGYEMNGERLAFLFNYAGKRISDVGTQNRPDIFEIPPMDLDFTYAKTFDVGGRDLEFSVKIKNILNDGFERTQGGLIYESYPLGRSYSAGLKIKL